jgi:hypothetical protein
MVRTSVIAVTTAATLLTTGGNSNNDLKTVICRNDSGSDIFIGGPTVTVGNGLRIPTASSVSIDLGPFDDLYGIAGTTLNLQVLTTRAQ